MGAAELPRVEARPEPQRSARCVHGSHLARLTGWRRHPSVAQLALSQGTLAPPHAGEASKREIQEEDVDVLNQRLAEARQSEVGGGSGMAAPEAAEPEAAGEDGQPSFLKSTDEEVASALADRIAAMAAVQASGGSDGGALTGPLIKELLLSKWGKAYDLSFVRRDPPLGKTLISLNVSATQRACVRRACQVLAGQPASCALAMRCINHLATTSRAPERANTSVLCSILAIQQRAATPAPSRRNPCLCRRSCGRTWSSAASR